MKTPSIRSKFNDAQLRALSAYVARMEEEHKIKLGSASQLYMSVQQLNQASGILRGKPMPIVAVAFENLELGQRLSQVESISPDLTERVKINCTAHQEMARALIGRMDLGQKIDLLMRYKNTPVTERPQTIIELGREVAAQVEKLRQQQLQQQRLQQKSRGPEMEL